MIFIYKIDYEKIRENISLLNKSDYLVIKSNAYGFGFKKILEIAVNCKMYKFAVIDIDDAIFIKKNYPKTRVLLLGVIDQNNLELCEKYNIEVTINKVNDVKFIYGHNVNIQIEINSGMNRFGIRPKELKRLISLLHYLNINITGIYSHNATKDTKFINDQLKLFYESIESIKGVDVHYSSSYLKDYKINSQTARRIGECIYRDALTVYGKIIQINSLEKDEYIGYDFSYKMKRDGFIGVVDIGYADGLERKCEGFEVFIKDRYYPLVGRACMNHCFVLLEDDKLLNEIVIFIGNGNNISNYVNYFDKINHEIYLSYLKSFK